MDEENKVNPISPELDKEITKELQTEVPNVMVEETDGQSKEDL